MIKKQLQYSEIYEEGDDARCIMPFADYVTLFNNTVILQVDTYRQQKLIRSPALKGAQVVELVSIDHEFHITLALEKQARCRMIAATIRPDGKLSFLSTAHDDTSLLQLKLTPK